MHAVHADRTVTHHVLVRITSLLQSKHVLIDDRMDIICLNGTHHIIHQRLAAHVHTAHSADMRQ